MHSHGKFAVHPHAEFAHRRPCTRQSPSTQCATYVRLLQRNGNLSKRGSIREHQETPQGVDSLYEIYYCAVINTHTAQTSSLSLYQK